MLDSLRSPIIAREDFTRVVIGVDPAVSENEDNSAETGVIACAMTKDNKYCVIADRSGRYSPAKWGQIVVNLYNQLQADMIVVETNQGGNLVTENITRVSRCVRIKKIHAKNWQKITS